MFDDSMWSGTSIQQELLRCEIVGEEVVTDSGAGYRYFLKIGYKVIPVGVNKHFADLLQFALVRNARAFDTPPPAEDRT